MTTLFNFAIDNETWLPECAFVSLAMFGWETDFLAILFGDFAERKVEKRGEESIGF